jgi:hypothetical protein
MNAIEQILIEEIQSLPPKQVSEVDDFVDFLRYKKQEPS